MKKFEVGKIYEGFCGSVVKYEITKRTAKTVTYQEIYHYGRYNEYKGVEKTKRVKVWNGDKEVIFLATGETVIA